MAKNIVIQTIQTKMQTQRTVILMEIHRARTKTPIRTAAIHVQMFRQQKLRKKYERI